MPQSVDGKPAADNWDRVFDALSAEPRRQIVVSLRDAAPDDALELPDAAVTARTPADRDRFATSLYHRHLPALATPEYVEWDRDRGLVRRGPNFDHVAAVFRAVYADASALPPALVDGCRGLERRHRD